jgi:hypothetical protein
VSEDAARDGGPVDRDHLLGRDDARLGAVDAVLDEHDRTAWVCAGEGEVHAAIADERTGLPVELEGGPGPSLTTRPRARWRLAHLECLGERFLGGEATAKVAWRARLKQ